MSELKKVAFISSEVLFFLVIGLFLLLYIVKDFYAIYEIELLGNIWINWFGISYILFALNTLIIGLFLFKDKFYFRRRLTSLSFWILFIGANAIFISPFIIGHNPF